MFLAKKRDGRIRGRECSYGRGQCGKFKEEDAASPTVATEIISIASAIDAHERRDVAAIYIPGSLLHADSDNHIIVILKEKIALLLCKVDPKLYRNYIILDKRSKPVLYVKMLKDLYGMI